MALSPEDKIEMRALIEDAVAQITAAVTSNLDNDEPLTPEAEREILERMASNEPGIPHDEAMRSVFGEVYR